MSRPTSLTDEKICFGDLEIFLWQMDEIRDNFADFVDRHDVLFMQKNRVMVESYDRIKRELESARNIFEIGILRGGSAAFFHRYFEPTRLVCVDLFAGPIEELENYTHAHACGIIRTYYDVNQIDRTRLDDILKTEFPEPIDLVIDDASHLYEETKAALEAALPYVRNGGIYVIEDWPWSHFAPAQRSDHIYSDRLSLTNLVFELVMALGSNTGVITDIGFGPCMMWVRRGWAPLPKANFRLDDFIRTRGRVLGRI